MALASFNAMGMNAVPMAFTEVYPALEIRTLDGYEHPLVDMYGNKMFEPPAELEKIRAAVQPVIDKNSEAISAQFVQSFYAELKKSRSGR